MRTKTGMPRFSRVLTASKRSVEDGACGSISLAKSSLSAVIVTATIAGVLPSKSVSLVTSVDLVTIWIRHLLSESIWRHFRVKPNSWSIGG